MQALFILKKGRIRIFRTSADGQALTTAIIEPGTILGEIVAVGQQMHGSFAETMGRRLGELEQGITHEQLAALAKASRQTTTKCSAITPVRG